MKRREPPLEPELQALLNPGKIERRAPPEVRARALARGRAIVAAGGRIPPTSSLELLPPPSAKAVRSNGLVRIGLPTSLAAAVVAIGAAAALRSPPARTQAVTVAVSAQPTAAASEPVQGSSIPPEAAAPPLVAPPKPARSAHPDGELATTELQLLARAQAAYMRHDFTRAIALVSELTRRFPNGHLAEEREALRVRSLLGAGRMAEGQRAGAAFADRFPRSVLLPKDGRL
jgi:hypothetical protein